MPAKCLVTPLAIIVTFALGVLIGGWWVALLLLPLYLTAATVGYVLTCVMAGTQVLAALKRPTVHPVWALVTGLVTLGALGLIPFVGGLIAFVAASAGLGGLVIAVADAYRSRTQAAPVPPVEQGARALAPAGI